MTVYVWVRKLKCEKLTDVRRKCGSSGHLTELRSALNQSFSGPDKLFILDVPYGRSFFPNYGQIEHTCVCLMAFWTSSGSQYLYEPARYLQNVTLCSEGDPLQKKNVSSFTFTLEISFPDDFVIRWSGRNVFKRLFLFYITNGSLCFRLFTFKFTIHFPDS